MRALAQMERARAPTTKTRNASTRSRAFAPPGMPSPPRALPPSATRMYFLLLPAAAVLPAMVSTLPPKAKCCRSLPVTLDTDPPPTTTIDDGRDAASLPGNGPIPTCGGTGESSAGASPSLQNSPAGAHLDGNVSTAGLARGCPSETATATAAAATITQPSVPLLATIMGALHLWCHRPRMQT